jgi:YgiT-type zinc finger domain-containing protein
MTCVVCRTGQTRADRTTVTLERGSTTLVFKGVPAEVCTNCGEAYVDQETTQGLLQEAEEAARSGVQVHIREFATVRS